jgi:Tol biopolymer transport system component
MRLLLNLSILCLICIMLMACNQQTPITTDGSWIAYTSEGHVFVVSVNGGEPIRLTPKSFDEHPTKWACWSPDGTHLVFLAGWDVFMIHNDGSELANLTNSQERDEGFSLSPDGATIAVKGKSLRLIDLAAPNSAHEPNGSHELDTTTGIEEYWSWSPEGAKLLFHNKMVYFNEPEKTGWHVWTVNVDGSGLQQLTEAKHNMRPVWSPDGSKIAFESTRDGSREIYVMSADGSDETRLTFSKDPDTLNLQPAWSPDGSKIAYVSDADGDTELYIMNADGTNQVRLTDNSAWELLPSWSLDGSRIAFVRDESGQPMFFDVWGGDLYVINADGTGEIQLATDLRSVTLPAWQPPTP